MVVHKCPRCHYETKDKSCMKRHFKRKNICPPIYENCSIEECRIQLEQKSKPICEYCNKQYSRIDSLKRHYEKCKSKQIAELKNQLEKYEKIGNNNNINSTVNSHNTINIQINSYNNTDYSIIDVSKLNDFYIANKDGNDEFDLAGFLEYMHFNEEHPENHNMYIKDREGNLMIFDGKKFNQRGSGVPAIEKLLTKLGIRIDRKFKVKIKDNLLNKYKQCSNKEQKEMRDSIKDVCKNGKELVLRTHQLIEDDEEDDNF